MSLKPKRSSQEGSRGQRRFGDHSFVYTLSETVLDSETLSGNEGDSHVTRQLQDRVSNCVLRDIGDQSLLSCLEPWILGLLRFILQLQTFWLVPDW